MTATHSNSRILYDHTRFGLIERDVSTIYEILRRYPDVKSVYIFGSRAKGTYKIGSDIDLAVMNSDVSDKSIRQLQSDFEESSLPYRVDLLHISQLHDNAVKEHIMRVGKPFYQHA